MQCLRRRARTFSALSRGLGEKRLVLRHNFHALTIWTSNRLFLVVADGHREGETLVTLFTKIFVNRHMGGWVGLINQTIVLCDSPCEPTAAERRSLCNQSSVKVCVKPAAQRAVCLLRNFLLLSRDFARKALELHLLV